MKMQTFGFAISTVASILPCASFAQEPSFSTGRATTVIEGLIDCGRGTRVSAVGEITSEDGTVRTVPAATHYQTAPHAADLYNGCAGFEPGSLAEVDVASIAAIPAGGDETFTAYIFADNYFELYVNGQLIAVDPVPFTPFNSNIVKFTAERPVTLAVMGVDWEENLGLGSEAGRGSNYYPGDAGIVMRVEDNDGTVVAITDDTWRAQTFYVSPLNDRACLTEVGEVRDSSACSTDAADDGSTFSAAYWDVPEDWMAASFDDSVWPLAATFSNDTVGVNNKPGYTNFTEIFDADDADASFIWSSNLVLDNLVLLRTTIE
ncbi:MAG: hypothetical protein AAFP98_04525 [Pseudomonadota bacterium]